MRRGNFNNTGNWNFQPMQNGGFSPNYQQNQNMNAARGQAMQQFGRKKSGAKSGVTKSGKMYVNGWKVMQGQGIVSVIAGPTKDTDQHTSKTGRIWENWCAKITKPFSKPELVSCLYDTMTGKVIIGDLGLVLNPKAPNGGYFGKFGGKK